MRMFFSFILFFNNLTFFLVLIILRAFSLVLVIFEFEVSMLSLSREFSYCSLMH